jgi:hypothetical protein
MPDPHEFSIRTYEYSVTGTAGANASFTVSGHVHCDFAHVFNAIMTQTFQDLTSGKAVFGQPGVGCKGPYQIDSINIKRAETRR